MKKSILLLSSILILFSCSTENQNEKVQGKWTGVSWTVNGQPSGRDNVVFQFNADDTYSVALGTQAAEAGTYKLKGSKLYSTETGKKQKVVEISIPAPDTMIMHMNRAGDEEMLTLVKE